MISRRSFLTGTAAASAGLAGGAAFTFRLHKSPRRTPYLTDEHLETLAKNPPPAPSVLFIGNSMVLRNDLPEQVAKLARSEGITLTTATAAAGGARLIETIRIPGFTPTLNLGWSAIIVQDFSKTPFRAPDRWGSTRAIAHIARAAAPSPILLYPPMARAAGNVFYTNPGFLTDAPNGPEDFANKTMGFYKAQGHPTVPVPHLWNAAIQDGQALYEPDGHHPNPAGTAFVARIIWDRLKPIL